MTLETMSVCRTNDDFNFDALSDLASKRPEDFEKYRLAKINQIINRASNEKQLMLMRLQFRIDAERIRSRTPLKSCLRISSLMWDSLVEMRAQLNEAVYGAAPGDNCVDVAQQPANGNLATITLLTPR